MSMFSDLFKEYESLVEKADQAFLEVQGLHGSCIRCREGCSDCCNSVFGLFPIEAAYLSHHFGRLGRKVRREAGVRGEKAGRELQEVQQRLAAYDHNPGEKGLAMARERVRCPLLNKDEKCDLYQRRPITCRVYGIPAVISGRLHACWKAGFEKGKPYPAFNLDAAYRELYGLSQRIMQRCGVKDPERAGLLLSVPMAIKTPAEELFKATEDMMREE